MDELSLERTLRSSAPDIEPAPAAAYHSHSYMHATSITLGSNGSPCPYIGNMFPGPPVSPFRTPDVPLRPFWPTTPENYGRYGMPQGLYPFYPSFSPTSPSNDSNPYVTRLGTVPTPFPPLLNSYKDSSYFPSPYRLSAPLIPTSHSSFNLLPQASSKSSIEEDKSKPDDLLNYELTKPSHISCSKPESQVKRLSDKSKEFGKVKSKSSEKLPTVIFCGTKECIECDDTRGSIDYSKSSKAFTTFRHQISNVTSSHTNVSENISSLANPPSNVTSTMPVKVCVTTPALRASPIVSPSQNISSYHETKLTKAEKSYAATSLSPYNEEMPNLESYHSRCTMVTPYSASRNHHKTPKYEKKKKEIVLNKTNTSSAKTQPETTLFPASVEKEKVEVQALNLSVQETNTSEPKSSNRNETIGVCYPTTKLSSQSSCNQAVSVHSQLPKNSNSCHVSKPLVNNSKSSLKSFTESSLSKRSIENRKTTKGSGDISGTIPVGIAIAHQRSQQNKTPQLKPIKADKTPNTSNLDPIVPSKIIDSLMDKDLKKVENLSKIVTESNLSSNTWNPENVTRNSFPQQPWLTSAPVITPTFWLNQANDLTAGFQLARDPLTGHLYLIPNSGNLVPEVATEHSNNIWPTLLSVPNSSPITPIPQLLNQPQILSQQIVNQEHLSAPPIALQPQPQEKPFEVPTQTSESSSSSISLTSSQPFTYTTFPAAPTISYFFESSSVVQLPPNNTAGADSGKRSQGTSPLHPCSSPHSSSEDTLIEGDVEDNINVAETTQVKVNNHSISTAIQVDMSSDDDFEEKPVELFDSGIQTDTLFEYSKDSTETNKDSDPIEAPSKPSETPNSKPAENEVELAPPVLIAESKPVMDFIDYHGLNLLVDSIEEFASREQSNLSEDLGANQKEMSQAELQSSMTDGLGLLCALAEQRFKEEKLNESCNLMSQKSKHSSSRLKLNFLNLQNKYRDRNKKLAYYKNKTKKKNLYKLKSKQMKKKYLDKKQSKFNKHSNEEMSEIGSFTKDESDSEIPNKKQKKMCKSPQTKHETSLYDELWFIRRSERIFLHDAGVGTVSSTPIKNKVSNEKHVKSSKSETKKLKHKTSRKQKSSRKQKTLNYESKRIGSDVDSEDLPLSKYAPPAVRSCVLTATDLEEKIRVILMEDDLLYAGYVTAIRAPDVYGVVLDGERASRPHIFSREELLNEAIVEVKPTCPRQLPEGTRLCAYWSQQYRCLYPGTVAKAPATTTVAVQSNKPLIYVEFDDGDSGRIPLEDIRMLPADFPLVSGDDSLNQSNTKEISVFEEEENATKLKSAESIPKSSPKHEAKNSINKKIESKKARKSNNYTPKSKKHKKHKEEHKHRHHHKKHKKERSSSCSTPLYTCVLSPSSTSSTGSERRKSDLMFKIKTSTLSPSENCATAASEEEDTILKKTKKNKKLPSVGKSKIAAFLPVNQLWGWHGNFFRRVGAKGKAKKDLYKAIIREKEIISIGDCAVFISTGRPHLPYVGRIIKLWQTSGGNMMVRVNWFYHPEETKKTKKIKNTEGALFESPHMDENDVQTISHKCEVLKWEEYENRQRTATLEDNNDVYYLAGLYDPINNHMTLEPGVT